MIYLDNSATTKMDSKVLDAMIPFFKEYFGNPSSTYKLGQQSRFAIDHARRTISDYIHASPQEIIFTSGGTESINLAVKGTAEAMALRDGKFEPQKVHIITSSIEHSAVLSTIKHMGSIGFNTHVISVNEHGYINMEELQNVLNNISEKNIVATFQYANSEIGTIQHIKELVALFKQHNALIHIDAMQAAKFFELNVEELGIDMMTFAPHKFYGPKGIGALYLKKSTPIVRQQDGGQQEYYLRAGTENVAGIVGFGKAMELLEKNREENKKKTMEIRKYFEDQLLKTFETKIKFNSTGEGMPSVLSVVFYSHPADQLLIQLDMHDIAVSAGSACNSGSIQISPVLKSLGLPDEEAKCTVRFSFDHSNTKEEINAVIEVLSKVIRS